ncbi:MAG: aspartate kinase [Candidatus Eremiobacteraeota bacterium]|nr:aspartate kinase [Candidatus Eremiobacteraeota bacterium]
MKVVVQKFGGTSVATSEGRRQVGERVRAALERGLHPVLVLSAMGRSPDPYATDSLLELVKPFSEHADTRELDLLMGCGEIISCVLMSHYLRSLGYRSAALDAYGAGIRADGVHGDARIVSIEPRLMLALISNGGIPVVAGFQGVNQDNCLTTLGRGGSDTTAVAVGAALRAHYVEIYTDVDGVMTADPRILPEAQILPEINFEEMGELAGEGAKVVHPRAVELADDHGIPLWIKNTFGDYYGTYLSRAVPKDSYERTRIITGLAHVLGLSQVIIEVDEAADKARCLDALAGEGVNLDLINVTTDRLYCIVRSEPFEATAAQVLESLGFRYTVRSNCAKLSVVGAGMRGTPGVMARVYGCLIEAGVDVLHSTDSNITISFLIAAEQIAAAVAALHRRFIACT